MRADNQERGATNACAGLLACCVPRVVIEMTRAHARRRPPLPASRFRTLSGFRTDARNPAASGVPPSAGFLLPPTTFILSLPEGTSTMTANAMDMSAPVTRGELRAELQQVDTQLGG